MSKGPPGWRKFLECTHGYQRNSNHGHGRPLVKNQDLSDRKIGLFMDKQSIRALLLNFPQDVYQWATPDRDSDDSDNDIRRVRRRAPGRAAAEPE